MTWLKLTTKALYLMESNSDKYLEVAELKVHNSAAQEFKLSLPLEWFQGADAPAKMAIELDPSSPEPKKAPGPNVLEVFNKVITTDKWGAVDVSASPFPRTNPRFVIIHHTSHGVESLRGTDINPPRDTSGRTQSGAEKLARTFQDVHMNRREDPFADSGHNFLNSTGGFLLEGRHGSLEAIKAGQCVRSAHAAQDPGKLPDGNLSPGIENEGNFMDFHMVPAQWDSLVALCAGICKSCNIAPSQIRGHRDFSFTDCPGDWLYDQLPKLRAEVSARLKS